MLNLFAYTGGATYAAAAGAFTCGCKQGHGRLGKGKYDKPWGRLLSDGLVDLSSSFKEK